MSTASRADASVPVGLQRRRGVLIIDWESFSRPAMPRMPWFRPGPIHASPPVPNPQGKARIPTTSRTALRTRFSMPKNMRAARTRYGAAFQDGGTAGYITPPVCLQPPPMIPPGKAFQPGFAIAALVGRGAPNAIGPGSIFQVQPSRTTAIRPGPRRHNCGMMVGLADGSVRTLPRV